MGVSFDLFGTLVTAEQPADPAAAVASALDERGVSVPDDWPDLYATPHVDVPEGSELALSDHVRAALRAGGVEADSDRVERAVLAAFDPVVETRPGAVAAVAAARERGPVAVCSNCSVPGLVGLTLDRAALDPDAFDAVVTSVDCGWRKPDARIFEAVADALDVDPRDLVHVGDDPATDGGVERVGGTAIRLSDVPLSTVPDRLAEVMA